MLIRTKLLLSFGGLAIVAAAIAGTALMAFARIDEDMERMRDNSMKESRLAERMSETLRQMDRLAHQFETGPEPLTLKQDGLNQLSARFLEMLQEAMATSEAGVRSAEEEGEDDEAEEEGQELELLKDVGVEFAALQPAFTEFQRRCATNRNAALELWEHQIEPRFAEQLEPRLQQYFAGTHEEMKNESDEIAREIRLAARLIILAVAAIFITALGLTFYSRRTISGPLTRLEAAVEALGRGQATNFESLIRADELGQLARAFHQMTIELKATTVSRDYVDSIVESMPDGLFVVNAEGRIESANDAAAQLLGVPLETLKGRDFVSALGGDDARAREHFDWLRAEGSLHYEDVQCRHVSGRLIPVILSGAAVKAPAGAPKAFVCVLRDITARIETETALRDSEARFRSVTDSAGDGIVVLDATGVVLSWNQGARAIFGYAAGEIAGQSIDRLLTERFRSTHEKARQHLMATGGSALGRPVELAGQRRDGTEIFIEINLSSWKAGGELFFGNVIRDITERKQAEAEMTRLNAQLVESSRFAGMAEIATGVLHNVGNVLNSLNVSATLVSDQLRGSKVASLVKAVTLLREHEKDLGTFITADPKGRQLPGFLEAVATRLTEEQAALKQEIRAMQDNVDHVKQIVAMQQAYAKVGGVREPVEAGALVEEALRLSQAALARHQIEVVRDYSPVPTVMTDRHKVLQILVNLITNAKHALDERAEGRRLALRIQGDGGRVRIAVDDNGAGITAENLTRIFQHGFTTRRDGHGFGLHSGANAAKELGGSLQARSEGSGQGAIFILELPVAPEELNAKAA